VIGLSADDRAIPTEEERTFALIPETEDFRGGICAAVEQRDPRIESSILAKGFEVKSNQARRLPQIDLVAQYALLAKFNHYEDYFPLLPTPQWRAWRVRANSGLCRDAARRWPLKARWRYSGFGWRQ